MAKPWTSPKFPRGRVDWAGNILASSDSSETDLNDALDIINNWRSSHSYPLQALKMTLRRRAREIDGKALIVQRLKRLISIAAKLGRNKTMQLSQMQDIGGCRAVLKDIRAVQKLAKVYADSHAKNPNVRAQFVKPFDYIEKPKVDGYRSIHLIYKYRSNSQHHRVWNGLRIEIQIRSRLQHAWATAVETVDAFTGQGLKVSGGTGTEKKDWGRFFVLMSSAIALRENCPMAPNCPSGKEELVRELKTLAHQLQVEPTLAGWAYAMTSLREEAPSDSALFLLILDTTKYKYSWTGYRRSEMQEAQQAYLDAEKEIKTTPGSLAVLVSADSMDAVRAAYPNFYADTKEFVLALQDVIGDSDLGEQVPPAQKAQGNQHSKVRVKRRSGKKRKR